MASPYKDVKCAEIIERITILHDYASKTDNKILVDAMKVAAKQASEELLALVGYHKVLLFLPSGIG